MGKLKEVRCLMNLDNIQDLRIEGKIINIDLISSIKTESIYSIKKELLKEIKRFCSVIEVKKLKVDYDVWDDNRRRLETEIQELSIQVSNLEDIYNYNLKDNYYHIYFTRNASLGQIKVISIDNLMG